MTVWGPGAPKYRRGRPVRKSRRTVKSVKASCDRAWSQLVRARAGYHCERCGATPEESQLHAHHVDGRNNHRLRFDPRNGVCLCARCHRWGHDHPLLYSAWFQGYRLEDARYVVHPNQRKLIKRDLQDYLELEANLKDMLSEAAGSVLSASGGSFDA